MLVIVKKSMTFMKKAIGNKHQTQLEKKVWRLIIFSVFIIVHLLYCLWLFLSLQGKFSIERITTSPDPLTSDVDWHFMVKVLDGLKVYEYEFGRFYGDGYHVTRDIDAFSPNYELTSEIMSKNPQTHGTLLAIWGKNDDRTRVLTLVRYNRGKFTSIRFDDGSSDKKVYFAAHQILLKNLDNDPELEVILGNPYVSDNQSTLMWTKRHYDYSAEKDTYFQTSLTHEPNLE